MLNFFIFSKIYLSVNCSIGEPAVWEVGVGVLACRSIVLSVNQLSVYWVTVNCLSVNRPGPNLKSSTFLQVGIPNHNSSRLDH
jgi:hypothetical protein